MERKRVGFCNNLRGREIYLFAAELGKILK